MEYSILLWIIPIQQFEVLKLTSFNVCVALLLVALAEKSGSYYIYWDSTVARMFQGNRESKKKNE